MFYIIVYMFLAALVFSDDNWQLAFWISLVLSVNFMALYFSLLKEMEDGTSVIEDTKPKDHKEDFETPSSVLRGTYGMLLDYGYRDDMTHISFLEINRHDVGRISAALSHIDRMMSCGRSCYVVGYDGFTLKMITRCGAVLITYIEGGECVTKYASDINCVVISPSKNEDIRSIGFDIPIN